MLVNFTRLNYLNPDLFNEIFMDLVYQVHILSF